VTDNRGTGMHLGNASLDWALKHIERYGDTDIFPIPFEYQAIRYCWEPGQGFGEIRARGFRELLRAMDLSAWALRRQRRCIAPKNLYGFRIATQLDPIDALLFAALIYELGEEIEAARISTADEIVHSYRFKPADDGEMFDLSIGYRTFLKKAKELAQHDAVHYVVTADIADFYPRVYSHPLENALPVVTAKLSHIKALLKFLGQLNQGVSYGLPVGPSGSRLLAELVLSDVDRLLLSEEISFIRFVDDYRIFCRSERDAYNALAKLANSLFENHGLTLQQHKTRILPVVDYLEEFAPDGEDLERARLSDEFERIVEEIGLDDPYGPIVYDDLTQELKNRVDGLNLLGILEEQIGLDVNANTLTIRFLLRRFAQLNEGDALDMLLEAPRVLYLVLHAFSDYVGAISKDRDAPEVGKKILSLLVDDVLGHLEFNRAWLLHPFSTSAGLNCATEIQRLLQSNPLQLERRELLLALGNHGAADWLGANRRNFDQETPWCRRAFLAAAKALRGDQAPHWYKAVRPQLDLLEQGVAIWSEGL